MKLLLAVAAAGEALTGLILFIIPANVIKLLFGLEITDAGAVMSRVAAIALISLGLACWPGRDAISAAVRGLITYGLLMMVYLTVRGIGGATAGTLLWPAVVLHGALTFLLIVCLRRGKASGAELPDATVARGKIRQNA